jgi:hypothetical protein
MVLALTGGLASLAAEPTSTWESGLDLIPILERTVSRRLAPPPDEQAAYAQRLDEAFAHAGIALGRAQYVLLVDRNPRVQAALLYWYNGSGRWHLIGAVPVSTGRRGGFEHFVTPTGIFEHGLTNLDFRAEGTVNELGVRGYGIKGMRVFDFGWVLAERSWDRRGTSPMRLQVHATDPVLLEGRLGTAASKGCIRIPAAFNHLLDHYGVLDADYDIALAHGATFWMLPADREATPWSGRFLVVVDSGRGTRPDWAKTTTTPAAAAAPRPRIDH